MERPITIERTRPKVLRIVEPLINDAFGRERILQGAGGTLLKTAQQTVSQFTNQERIILVNYLVQGIAQDNEKWDVDKRDASLAVLSQLPLGLIPPIVVKDIYLTAVNKQTAEGDPLGSVDSLLDAGKILLPYFPTDKDSRTEIETAWSNVAERVQDKASWDAVSSKADDITIGLSLIDIERFNETAFDSVELVTPLYQQTPAITTPEVVDSLKQIRLEDSESTDQQRRDHLQDTQRRQLVFIRDFQGKSETQIAEELDETPTRIVADLSLIKEKDEQNEALTAFQKKILLYKVRGLTDQEIYTELDKCPLGYVAQSMQKIHELLGTNEKDFHSLVKKAFQMEILDPDEVLEGVPTEKLTWQDHEVADVLPSDPNSEIVVKQLARKLSMSGQGTQRRLDSIRHRFQTENPYDIVRISLAQREKDLRERKERMGENGQDEGIETQGESKIHKKILLHKAQGFTDEETKTKLNCPLNTVPFSIRKAHKELGTTEGSFASLIKEALRKRILDPDEILGDFAVEKLQEISADEQIVINALIADTEGLSDEQLADKLSLSYGKVKGRLINVRRKLGLKNKLHLIGVLLAHEAIESERDKETAVETYLKAVGNHEGKALLLGLMETNVPISSFELCQIIRAKKQPDDSYTIRADTPKKWFDQSLVPTGLAKRIDIDGKIYYELTEKGELAKGLVGHELKFSEENPDISLIRFLGDSPNIRSKIFYELLQKDLPINAKRLIPEMPMTTLTKQLSELNKQNIITYAADPDKFDRNDKSQVSLTADQQQRIVKFVEILDRFVSKDENFLRDGKQTLEAVVEDSERFSKLFQKAMDKSPHKNPLKSEDISKAILTIIKEHTELSTEDLRIKLTQALETEISIDNLQRVLRPQREEGKVVAVKKGRKIFFRRADEDSEGFPSSDVVYQSA